MGRFFASVLAGAAVVVTAAVSASSASAYVPDGRVSISQASVSPGGVVTISASSNSFLPQEPVRVAVNGYAATQAALGLLVTASVVEAPAVETASTTGQASPSGALLVEVTAPDDGRGSYAVELRGLDSGRVYTGAFSVVPTAEGGDPAGGALPNTGADSFELVGLGAIGLAGLLGGALAIASTRRRQGASTAER